MGCLGQRWILVLISRSRCIFLFKANIPKRLGIIEPLWYGFYYEQMVSKVIKGDCPESIVCAL
jgi:hypothetical protein